MDGVSGAASVIAILQLLESVVKLVEFGKSVRDVPANVEALFNDLDLLSAVLAQTHKSISRINLDEVTTRVIKDCENKVSVLDTKIRSAASHLRSDSLRRRTWSALKIALKSNEIALLRQSIADAKATLQLVLHDSLL